VSEQVQRVDTLFLHETGGDYAVEARRDDERLFRAKLELTERDAGPRPGKFRVQAGSGEEPRSPDQFVEIARRAGRIRISQQTSRSGRQELQEMLGAYQLEATAVRTCRYCAGKGRYSPITSETAIKADDEYICQDCAVRELERELAFNGNMTGAAQARLEELLFEEQDLGKITGLLGGNLDPDLTKFDEVSATTDDIDPVPVSDLDLHPDLQGLLEDRFDDLLPVQSLRRERPRRGRRPTRGVGDGDREDPRRGDSGPQPAARGEREDAVPRPLVALANQKHEDFRDEYGHLANVTIRVGSSRIRDDGHAFDPPPTSSSGRTRASTTRCARGRTSATSALSSSTRCTR